MYLIILGLLTQLYYLLQLARSGMKYVVNMPINTYQKIKYKFDKNWHPATVYFSSYSNDSSNSLTVDSGLLPWLLIME